MFDIARYVSLFPQTQKIELDPNAIHCILVAVGGGIQFISMEEEDHWSSTNMICRIILVYPNSIHVAKEKIPFSGVI